MPQLDTRKIRMPAVAGQFYDADPLNLRRQLMTAAAKIPPRLAGAAAKGVILPHAGYVFSMPTALRTLHEAAGGAYRRAVILSPSHRIAFRGAALTGSDALRTPFGDLSADGAAAKRLAEALPEVFAVREDAHAREHAVEVQLPLLQYYFRDMTVLPVVCGEMPLDMIRQAAEVLAREDTPETLWVVSSDFTHDGRYFGYVPFTVNVRENLYRLDGEAAALVARRDFDGFADFLRRTRATICGMFPILLYLELLRRTGSTLRGRVVEYTQCGDQTGDWSHCVGYAGIAFL